MSMITGIILAAGQGRRMNTSTSKQYLLLNEKPILAYAVEAFDKSTVDNIIIVCPQKDMSYCKEEIVDKYSFSKVTHIIEGGKERYDSVFNALEQCKQSKYVLIHDGVRPFISTSKIDYCIDQVKKYEACVFGVPIKDTIKVGCSDGYVEETLDRSKLWSIQTPQAFNYTAIYHAYKSYYNKGMTSATDDSSIFELFNETKVKILMGDYSNIKITTVEDLMIAKVILEAKL